MADEKADDQDGDSFVDHQDRSQEALVGVGNLIGLRLEHIQTM